MSLKLIKVNDTDIVKVIAEERRLLALGWFF